jgi:hypothetical protein
MRVSKPVINICNLSLIGDSGAGTGGEQTVLMSESRMRRFEGWPGSRPDTMNAVNYGQ